MRNQLLQFKLRDYQKTELPLAVWPYTSPALFQGPHVHDCYEIVIVTAGTGWCGINALRFPILRGDIYVIRPGDSHEYSANQGLKFYNLMVAETFFTPKEREIFQPVLKESGKSILPGAVWERMELLLAQLSSELREIRPGNVAAARALCVLFLVELVRHRTRSFTFGGSRENMQISRMLGLIARRYRQKLTLGDLAAETGNSPEYAGRLFKNLTGITFSDYLIRYRVDQSCALLENGSESISEISAELGYFDTAYFDKCFRRIMGMSPQIYRERFRRKKTKS